MTEPSCMPCNYVCGGRKMHFHSKIRITSGLKAISPQNVELPQLSCIAFRVLAERLVRSRASRHRTRGGSWKCRWGSFRNLLPEVADPLLLLVLGEGQQKHVPGRGHIVVYCGVWRTKWKEKKSAVSKITKFRHLNILRHWLTSKSHSRFKMT